jgi:broad specificity phosphatase PhoE
MSETTRICVVRHGETDWNISGILQGWLDVPLNERGRAQAHESARAFGGAGFSCVYTSPLARSSVTAEIIAHELRLPPPFRHGGLKERNFGLIQGIPKAELAELNPALLQQILQRNPAARFEGGESMDECAVRVLGAITDIADANPRRRVLAVTHGWAMDVVTRHVRGLPRSAIMHRKPGNGECLWLAATSEVIRPLPADEI